MSLSKEKISKFLKDYFEICLRYSICIAPKKPNELLGLSSISWLNLDSNYTFDKDEIDHLLALNNITCEEEES